MSRSITCRRGSCARCSWRRYRRKVAILSACYLYVKRRKRARRRFWVGEDLKTREQKGEYHLLVNDLRTLRVEKYRSYFRMPPETFNKLLGYVKDAITKITTNMRKPISAEERLAVTLHFLAQGGTYTNLAMRYRMSKTILSKIIPETCQAIWDKLHPIVMPTPTKEMWTKISAEFERKCQFPCLGSIDGKHVRIRSPKNSGTTYFNYRKSFSIVLLGVADANSKFVIVDVGGYGKSPDSRILQTSKFGTMLLDGRLPVPSPRVLPGQSKEVPHVFVADEAFPLKPNLLRPYPGSSLNRERSVFNYRLSRARRVVEMAFGILVARFRVLYERIDASPECADKIVKACTVLHNFLFDENVHEFTSMDRTVSHNIANNLMGLQRVGRPYTEEASAVRQVYTDYFVSTEGSVPWQIDHVTRTA